MAFGVYVHFPWCRKRCPYCDFAIELGEPAHDAYLAAVTRELDGRAAEFSGSGELASIYLGGGTPSLWRTDCLAELIARIRERFAGSPREVTIEANPTDCTEDNLAAWRAAGIGRISIGVQSLAPGELITLGRDHRFGDGPAAIARCVAAGFAISADFIFGAGGAAGAPAIDTTANHLSIYELTIEDRTAFGQRVRDGRFTPLPDDALEAIYVAIHDQLSAAGYDHYEISSYARPGARAVHNSLYWRGEPFLGLGVGAASLTLFADGSGRRATNPRRAADYLANPGEPVEIVDQDAAELAADRAWLGLRTADGVAEADLAPAPGLADSLVEDRLADRRAGRICPTLRGFLLADRIASRVVAGWDAKLVLTG